MLQIYDTTLRDGTQREGISISGADKIRIAKRLDDLGVDFIEGGWPGSNPKDVEFFVQARDMEWRHAQVCAFGATCRVKGGPEDDPSVRALLASGMEVCTIFGKTWDLHVTEVLRTTLDENLRIIEQTVAFLKANGKRVIYDGEHTFDGYKADPSYAVETYKAAARGGAEMFVLCDTNGGAMPWEVAETTKAIKDALGGLPIGIHAHDDCGVGAANSLAAVREGAVHVQGTINGYGERCGNADLCTVIPDLELKMGMQCLPEGNLKKLYDLAHFVAEVSNLTPDEHKPFIGKSAFTHKAGVHVSAMRRNIHSYQHIDPALVGNDQRILVSELSGRSNLVTKAEEYGVRVDDALNVAEVLNEIKELEAQGFSFEAAEASAAIMLKRKEPGYVAPFELIDFHVNVDRREGRGIFAEALVKVRVKGEVLMTAAEGNGPVSALDLALRKALTPSYPALADFHLVDYKVRILDGSNGTEAITRVLIDTQNGVKRWSTVGASGNIIQASWRALKDSIEYGLMVAKA
ncbi:MAG: citramalate synthase [Anaerolineales bacterium]|nr:citramalate synthase [Anaerolineales bacterium]